MLQIAFRKRSKLSEHFFWTSTFISDKSHILLKKKILFKNPHYKNHVRHKFLISWIIHLLIDGWQVIFRTLKEEETKIDWCTFSVISSATEKILQNRCELILELNSFEDLICYYWSVGMLSFSCWQYYITIMRYHLASFLFNLYTYKGNDCTRISLLNSTFTI